ncbi:hypothetical protein LNV09_15065 [Paucibacter sp. B2R-40]|uniref:hypothetical protein n=1 Tax=Paucibacter sp. B2R-40 TaxID=2893554 RepID=UPI0021E4FE38|nr:hypothetical protein [Paucibacter sp. B2R-40]MCV2355469.1 hypothetical protein [Paucibacter sp. B2R-40]
MANLHDQHILRHGSATQHQRHSAHNNIQLNLHELPPDRKKKSFLPLNSQPAEHTPKIASTYMGKPWETEDFLQTLALVVVRVKQPLCVGLISSSLSAAL